MESFHRSLGNLPRNLWKLSANGKLPHQNSKEIPAVKAVDATFAFIYLCLLHSAGLNFSIKYISYVSCVFPSCKSVIILKFPLSHVLILPSCNSGCQIYFLQVFNLSLSIVFVCLIYFPLQPLQIMTQIKFLFSQINGTLISNFLLTVLKVCPILSLMYWQQTKLLLQFFTLEFELLGENELLHNILRKFGACHLELINLNYFNAFLIRSKVFKFSRVCLIIGKVLRLLGLKVGMKGKILFFSRPFTFLNSFWGIFKALFITDFIILSGQCCSRRSVSST